MGIEPPTNQPGVRSALLGFVGRRALRGLQERYAESMSAFSRLTKFEIGEKLFRRGDIAGAFYVIRNGTVAIELNSEGGAMLIQ